MDERDWTTVTPSPGAVLDAADVTIRCAAQSGATLISGNLETAIAELAPGAPMLGLLDTRVDPPFALRMARDRALLCTDSPLGVEGWHGRYAASAADDLFLEFTITGPGASFIQAACMSAGRGSPSAATLFGGCSALVLSLPEGISLRVQPPEAAALWSHLGKLSMTLQGS